MPALRCSDYSAVLYLWREFNLSAVLLRAGSVNLFPLKSRNNFCYVVVDPMRRLVKLWYHGMMPFW